MHLPQFRSARSPRSSYHHQNQHHHHFSHQRPTSASQTNLSSAFQSWSHDITHQFLNKVLLVIAGALLATEMRKFSAGMATIYTCALNYDQSSPMPVQTHSSGQSSASEPRSLNENKLQRTANQCPKGPPPQWESQLDAASKAYLAPIVFTGKLISISEDYGGRIGATFQVKKLIKNQSSLSPNLVLSSHVTLYFVRNKQQRSEPPFCALYMDENVVNLRPQDKYIVFASEPFSVLTNSLHMNSVAVNVDSNNQLLRPIASSHTVINLSTFASPEVQNKRTRRLVRKVLCARCGKSRTLIYIVCISLLAHSNQKSHSHSQHLICDRINTRDD